MYKALCREKPRGGPVSQVVLFVIEMSREREADAVQLSGNMDPTIATSLG